MKNKTYERFQKLGLRYFTPMRGISGTEGWNGHDRCIGSGSVYNHGGAQNQFLMSLAMSKHPEIERLIQKKKDKKFIDMNNLTEKKVLENIKILDLGCGYLPTFARLTRWLGAETYTTDVINANDFEFNLSLYDSESEKFVEREFPERFRKAEFDYHIQGDLNKEETLEKIAKQTGSNFDLVTSSCVEIESDFKGRDMKCYDTSKIANQMLKEGGVFFKEADDFYLKENGKLNYFRENIFSILG